jgi:hypothetical protein
VKVEIMTTTPDPPTTALPPAGNAPAAPPVAPRALWAGVLGSPVLWAIHLQLDYALVPWICGHGGHVIILHLLTVLFVILSAATFVLCWREWRSLGRSTADDAVGAAGRAVFLSILGMLTAALFTTIIFSQGIASFFLNPCWQ